MSVPEMKQGQRTLIHARSTVPRHSGLAYETTCAQEQQNPYKQPTKT